MKPSLTLKKLLTFTILALPVSSMFCLRAQDYQISFTGSGESTTVDSVFVENLTQGTTLEMKGTDVLHLKGTVSVFETTSNNGTGKLIFYPNPMKDITRMQFFLPQSGETVIRISDLSGRTIAQCREHLPGGEQTYSVQGIEAGVYFASVSSGRFYIGGKFISSGSTGNVVKMMHEGTAISQEKHTGLKGMSAESVMQYNSGDRLKLTGKSGIYRTVITDVPSTSKTITYDFIACTDGDGNNYPVVFISQSKGIGDNTDLKPDIGTQVWMGENLRTTTLTGGPVIPNVMDGSVWTGLNTPAYCWYNNNQGNKNVYGAIYNWFTVTSGKVCPSGFHVPTDAEWTVLENNLGGAFNGAALKLKETGTSHWHSPNTGATNETGFTARPGGYRTNVYDGISYWGRWWSSNEQTAPGKGIDSSASWPDFPESKSNYAWVRAMDNEFANTWRSVNEKYWGLSVRCLKD